MPAARLFWLSRADQDLDLLADGDHEIGELVDDHHDLRQDLMIELLILEQFLARMRDLEANLDAAAERLALAGGGADFLVEARDVAHTDRGHHPVAPAPFPRPPTSAHARPSKARSPQGRGGEGYRRRT